MSNLTPDVVWAGLFAVGLGYEAYGLFDKAKGDTLSERTRALFHTTTSKGGRAAFTVVWAGFSVWFLLHILTQTM